MTRTIRTNRDRARRAAHALKACRAYTGDGPVRSPTLRRRQVLAIPRVR